MNTTARFISAMPSAARTIWLAQSVPNQVVAFRSEFDLAEAVAAPFVLIAAGSDFILWCNGVEAGRGQYPDFPDNKSFSRIALPRLGPGRNLLAVLAYHTGDDFFTHMNTPAGIVAAVCSGDEILAVTGTGWRAAEHTGWRAGLMPRRSLQSCFTSEFDARRFPGSWHLPGFDASQWPFAVAHDSWTCRGERPVPSCRVGRFVPGIPVRRSRFRLPALPDPQRTPAEEMSLAQYDPQEATDGVAVIFDLKHEQAGFIRFEVTAPAGTVIDYAHGEHLDDGMVRLYINGRNFADRYFCQEGLNRHELVFHRVGARYLQLNIHTEHPEAVTVHAAGIAPWIYPFPKTAEFASDDPSGRPMREVSQRTMELCLHEHYEDCPWREQSLFAYDARNQALFGYHLWGNYEYARSNFALFAESFRYRSDHWMMMCAPMTFPRTIPVFSFVWAAAAWENYLYSGDRSLFECHAPMLETLIAAAIQRYDPATGLFHTGTTPEQWNFYEASPGLDQYGCGGDEFHAGYNLYFIELLECCGKLFSGRVADGCLRQAGELRRAVNTAFWDPERRAYAARSVAGRRSGEFHEHIQFLAFHTGTAAGERASQLLETLRHGGLHPVTLSVLPYMLRGLMPLSPEARCYAAEKLHATYAAMLAQGADTWWESELGAKDCAGAGSLCHAWSCLPVYYQSAIQLGVTPLEPGFRRFEVRPYADARTGRAAGTVPTPHGEIQVSWRRENAGLSLEVSHPAGLACTVAAYAECPVLRSEVTVRGGAAVLQPAENFSSK